MKKFTFFIVLLLSTLLAYSQNIPPVAVADSASVMAEDTIAIQVLLNDYDPDGNSFEVRNAYGPQHGETWENNDSVVYYRSDYYFGWDSLRYRIRDDGNPPEYSEYAPVYIHVLENPNLPVAVNDYAETLNEITVEINLLANDSDPNGDAIKILEIEDTYNGNAVIVNDSVISYTPGYFTGLDSVIYRVMELNTGKEYYSNWATVYITVNENPDIPVGVSDTFNLVAFEPYELPVIQNDYDPQNDPIRIGNVISAGAFDVSFNDSIIFFTSYPFPANITIYYYLEELNNPSIYSELIPVYINLGANPALPQAVNDYADMKAGVTYYINLIENDINPTNDSIFIDENNFGNNVEVLSDSVIQYTPWVSASGIDSLEYFVKRKSDGLVMSSGYLIADITPNQSFGYLDVNNIKAGINSCGLLFTEREELPGIASGDIVQKFEVPNGSGKHTIFDNTLWIGGIDQLDSLHLAGERYRQIGIDYWWGPVSNIYDQAYDDRWIGLWKITKDQIVYHVHHYDDSGYEAPGNILNWPGNGDPELGQLEQIAPFYDKDNNGIYEPMQGDYPLIRGDQAIFYIFNDDRTAHGETGGEKLGVEIHGMAYVFDVPSDSVLFNSIFIHYDIINRSDTTYNNTSIGNFTDFDIGYAYDDYIGSDVQRGMYFGYNGDDLDQNYNDVLGYGEHPPAQGVTILAGAFMDDDNQDNPAGGCDESINGMNFGNEIVDDERFGMTRFIAFENSSSSVSDPQEASQYYGYLNGFWKDNTNIVYGGNGHVVSGALGPACRFVFPGDSDSCNWGTGGQLPNGGYNQNGKYWTEMEVGNSPSDRRGVGISGPFTFEPGDVQQIDLAFTFARDYASSDPYASVQLLKQRIDNLHLQVAQNNLLQLPEELGIAEIQATIKNLFIYPNPVNSNLEFGLNLNGRNAGYKITGITGQILLAGTLSGSGFHSVDVRNLPKGLYFIIINMDDEIAVGKFIKE